MTDLRTQLQSTLGPGYTLERELGGGGMSRVFVARENALGRDVVVKVLAPELSASVSAERFTREIATAARLQQANIVPVLAAGTTDGMPYYTMPFVTGESLRAQMTTGTPLSMHDRVAVLRDVARALAYAHAQGVIHRDIKPENILLSGGAAVVTDFGIAKAISAARTVDGPSPAASDGTLTQVGSSVGTPAYMAPEQAVGETIDARADLYAWGVVAYELLAGVHPFAGKSGASQLIAAHIAEVPRALDVTTSAVPRDVSALVMQCLEKNPAQRPVDANALLARLSGVTTPSAAPLSANQRVIARLVAVTVVALAALALWLGFGSRGTSPAASDNADAADIVAVAPFDIIAPGAALLREGMVDLLARHFEGMGPLQSVAPSRSIRAWTASRADVASAQEHGRTLGAGLVIVGTIAPAGRDSVRALVRLVDVATGRAIAEADRQEALDRVDRLADSITLSLVTALSTLRPGLAMRATALGSRDVGAVRAFLRGEALFRAAVYDSAAYAFAEAHNRDSTFALAWMRSIEATRFISGERGPGSTSAFRAAALRIVPGATRGLSPRDSALLMAWVAYERSDGLAGAVGQGEAVKAALEASSNYLARFPDDPSLLRMRGEIQFSMGFAFPGTTARVTAETFDRAVRADSGFLAAYDRLLEVAPVVWGVERQIALANAYVARARDPVRRQAMMALVALASKPTASRALLDTLPTPVLGALIPKLTYWFDREGTAVTAMRAMNEREERDTGRPAPLAFYVANLEAARGRLRDIPALSSQQSYYLLMEPALEGYLLASVTDSLVNAWERRLASEFFTDYPPALVAAHVHAVRGDRARYEETVAFVRASIAAAQKNGRWGTTTLPAEMRDVLPDLARLVFATMEPVTALVAGNTAGALIALDTMPVSLLPGPAFLENRIWARALADAGRLDDAISRLGAVRPGGSFGFVADHVLRGRLAVGAGRADLARESWEIVASAWQDGDPEVQPVVKEAREALARLGARPPASSGRR